MDTHGRSAPKGAHQGLAFLVDRRIAGRPRYYIGDPEEPLTFIPEQMLSCVAFVGIEDARGDFDPRGTAFFLAHRVAGNDSIPYLDVPYLVTAQHNLDKVAKVSAEIHVRVNLTGKRAESFSTRIADWVQHPTDSSVDVAVLPISWDRNLDHKCFPIEERVNQDTFYESVDIGDELFFPGLFWPHYGQQRNIPIVRIGSIAAMPSEKVLAEFDGGVSKLIDAYLVEGRSIGGYSGSPAFANMTGAKRGGFVLHTGGPQFRLLGLVRGHYDEHDVNMGIALVIPAERILEVVEHPENQERERAIVESQALKRKSATADSAPASAMDSVLSKILTVSKEQLTEAMRVEKAPRDDA